MIYKINKKVIEEGALGMIWHHLTGNDKAATQDALNTKIADPLGGAKNAIHSGVNKISDSLDNAKEYAKEAVTPNIVTNMQHHTDALNHAISSM